MSEITSRRRRIALGLTVLVGSVATTGCPVPCENEPVISVASPSGKLRAVVFSRNCGATTGLNTQLSILPSGNPAPDDSGNVFVVEGTVPLEPQWISETELVVSGSRGLKSFKQEKHLNGVVISYR